MSFIVLLLIGFYPFDLHVYTPDPAARHCDILAFYETIPVEREAVALSTGGELIELDQLLVPTQMREGVSKVEVTRISKDVYHIERTEYYLQTQYCNEWARNDEVILEVEGNLGFKKGELIFKD